MQLYTKRGRKENVLNYVHTRRNALICVYIRKSTVVPTKSDSDVLFDHNC